MAHTPQLALFSCPHSGSLGVTSVPHSGDESRTLGPLYNVHFVFTRSSSQVWRKGIIKSASPVKWRKAVIL